LKYLKEMVGHSGTLINGDPIVCGGFNGTVNDVKCFLYDRDTKNWKRVNLLQNFVNYKSNVSDWKYLVVIYSNNLNYFT